VNERDVAATTRAAEEADAGEAARACLYAVVDRFNTEDEFWGSFVPEFESTYLGSDRFTVTLQGRGVRLKVQGVMLRDAERRGAITPSLIVASEPAEGDGPPRRWHPVTCTVDPHGRFGTENFRKAIEAAITDLRVRAS
jgi:hypothetical protein